MNSYSPIFMAGAGTNAAKDFLHKALQSRDLPKKFRSSVQNLHRRVESLDSTLVRMAQEARANLRDKYARLNDGDGGVVRNLNWAHTGLDNALDELKTLVRGDPTHAPALKEAKILLQDLESLMAEIQEYLDSIHPLDWAGEVYDELVEGFRASPSRVASLWKNSNGKL